MHAHTPQHTHTHAALILPYFIPSYALSPGLQVCAYLVKRGVDVNAGTTDGTPPLHWAVWQNHAHVCDFLVSRGADVHALNAFGCNAVQWAAQAGHRRMCEWLKRHGVRFQLLNNNGHSAFHKAAIYGHAHVCRWLHEEVRCCVVLRAVTWCCFRLHTRTRSEPHPQTALLLTQRVLCPNQSTSREGLAWSIWVQTWMETHPWRWLGLTGTRRHLRYVVVIRM